MTGEPGGERRETAHGLWTSIRPPFHLAPAPPEQGQSILEMLLATVLGLPGGSVVKNPPTVQEMWVRYLGWEDPLEKEMGTYSSILAWKIPWTEKLCELQSMRSQKSDMTERLIMHALPLTGRMEEENCYLDCPLLFHRGCFIP